MKKLILVLLTFSMVAASSGCSKKSEETSKKTKKTKDTEITETEDPETEEPETTTTPDTSESESSSESETTTSKNAGNYPISSDFVIKNDQKNLDMEIVSEPREFALLDSDNHYAEIYKSVDMIQLSQEETEAHEQLWNTLEANHYNLNSDFDAEYDKLLPELVNSVKNGTYKTDYTLTSDITVFRADTAIISYIATKEYGTPSVSNESAIAYNYRTSDGMEYMFDDIVTDRAGFADFFEKYYADSDADDYEKAAVKDLAKRIRDVNERIDFVIGYDAIYILDRTDSTYPQYYKIPAMFAGDYLDVSLFGSTPEYYTLTNDIYNRITWDLDGDGKMDEVSVEFETDEYDSIVNAVIVLNGTEKCPVPDSELVEGSSALMFVSMRLMKTDSGFYAYLEMSLEEEDSIVYVFRYDNGHFEYQSRFEGNLGLDPCYNPDNFPITSRNDIFGTGLMKYSCSVIKHNGNPCILNDYGDKRGIGITKKEIVCIRAERGQPEEETYTIPANTAVRLYGIDPEQGWILATTLNEDSSKNVIFKLKIEIEDGYKFKYGENSEEQDELFAGIRYAG